MAKKRKQPDVPKGKCGDCWYLIPDEGNRSFVTGEPIMGSCRYSKFMRLISEDACENFKNK